MRAGEEFAELAELGGYGGRGWSSRSSRSAARMPAEAEDALGPNNGSPRAAAHARSRSGLYYSPPGTSYTIVERPSSAMYHHRAERDREFGTGASAPGGGGTSTGNSLTARGGTTYLGSNPNFRSGGGGITGSNNKKRPISPEQVLRLFNQNGKASGAGGGSAERPRRSPASSPPSTTHNYRMPYVPTLHELSTRTVTMVREPSDAHGFGICVKGGKDAGCGVYISRVEEGSVAERSGLRPGDSILEVNGTPFTGVSHEDALKMKQSLIAMLKSCRKLSMTVKSPVTPAGMPPGYGTMGMGMSGGGGAMPIGSGGMMMGGVSWHLRQTCSWMDRHGRPVSPPLEYAKSMGGVPPQRYGYGRASSKDRNVRRVDLCIEPGQSLGLMIRGGVEYNLGIFVTGVDKDSVADRAGLMVGDQILEVNGQSFLDVTHDEAVSQLKYHKRMSLLVRDVGKVPHSCTAYDRDWDLCSPGSRAAQTTRKWAAALQMVEEKARCILTKPEFTTLCYYTDEYSARHMTIDAFVQVMTELLSTPDKYTLMIELREIIALDDRMRFDELVYRRDMDASALARVPRDPREHDYRHSRRKGEANHAMMMGGYPEVTTGEQINGAGGGVPAPEDYRSPSEDSGVGMGIVDQRTRKRQTVSAPGKDDSQNNQEYCSGDEENQPGSRSRRHSSPGESRTGSTAALHQPDYPDSELAHKLSRSFDMKDDQALLEGEGGLRRHQSMQRLARGDALAGGGPPEPPRVITDNEGNLRITVRKTKPILGIAIEGGANTKHPLPRIININENGAAYSAGGLEVGQLILQVDGAPVEGLQHQDVARLIAESFARRDREDIEFLVVEAKKSNMEPKPTALIFLEA